MLREIFSNNFRSLVDFQLSINKGINVLVGPNNAGKSNIVKLFEFVSYLAHFSLHESIGKAGGAGEIFYKKNYNKISENIEITGIGDTGKFDSWIFGTTPKKNHYYYKFSFTISLVENQVFFSKQKLQMWIRERKLSIDVDLDVPDLDVHWHYDVLTDKTHAELSYSKKYEKSQFSRMHSIKKEDVLKFISNKDFVDNSLIKNLGHFVLLTSIVQDDINTGRAYNIDPQRVRQREDIAESSGILYDGSRLSSTLYAIKQANAVGPQRYPIFYFRRHVSNNSVKMIDVVNHMKLADDCVKSIDVELDTIDNRIITYINYVYGQEEKKVPIAYLSDGSIKWLALITAVLTNDGGFYVEEPENFLHPKLQEEIVRILRAKLDSLDEENFAIVTTHSETFLNALYPQEIIVTKMEFGKTIARRPEYVNDIDEMIRESGFGLGYYYVTGALEI